MRPIKRAIVLCWIMLVACFAIKLFGWNWFEVVCTNEHFSNFCQFVDNHWFLYYPIGLMLYVASTSWIILSCSNISEPTTKEVFAILCSLAVVWSMQFVSTNVKTIIELANTILLPIILILRRNKELGIKQTLKKNWYRGIVGYILVLSFQFISLITRNVGIKYTDDSTLITLMLMFDYYIMVALFYLYVKKSKEG